ncbi:MAG: MlaE family ABC transporter permease [Puniceicoccaceae bacterium]
MLVKGRKAQAGILEEGNALLINLGGSWCIGSQLPDTRGIVRQIEAAEGEKEIRFLLEQGIQYDTALASFIFRLARIAREKGFTIELDPLPEQLKRLLELGRKVPEKEDAAKKTGDSASWIAQLGSEVIRRIYGMLEIATFTGEWVLAFIKLVSGKARLRWEDFWHILRTVSLDALPIVALISFLVGAIISFLGAVTLKQFGAEFAVSYLVGYGILREMGAIMTGIILAGRTGAAFAAQIGSMKINEEIDALRTLGISPIEFIVLPRLLALFLMMPLLTLYSNVIGILSGWVVAEGLMGVPGPVFFSEMQSVVGLEDFLLGIFKSFVFGILVATAGCLRGLQCGSGAGAVGIATTRAVVAGITLIVFSNAVIDWAAATLGV